MKTLFTLKDLEDSLCGNSRNYKKSLCLSENKAKQLIKELKTREFIEKYKEKEKNLEDIWRTTVTGNAFCLVKFLKPLKKEKSMILLGLLLERAQEINNSEKFLYFITYIGLFGSLSTDVEQRLMILI